MSVNYFANSFSLMPNSNSVADAIALSKIKPNPGILAKDILTDIASFRETERANNVKDIIGRTIAAGGTLDEANRIVDAMGYSVNDKARADMQNFANTATAEQRKVQEHPLNLDYKRAQIAGQEATTQSTIDENKREWDKHGYRVDELRLSNIGLGLDNTKKAIDNDQTVWLNNKTRRDDRELREVAGFTEALNDVASYGKDALLGWLNTPEVKARLQNNPLLQSAATTFMTNKNWDRVEIHDIKPIESSWKATPEIEQALPLYETNAGEIDAIKQNSIYQGNFNDKFDTVDKYTDHIVETAALTEYGKKDPDVSGDRKLKIKKDLNNLIKGIGAQVYQETGVRLSEREILGIIDRNFDPSWVMNPLADTRASFDRDGALNNALTLAKTRDKVMPFINVASRHIEGIKGSRDRLAEYNTKMDSVKNLMDEFRRKYPNRSKEYYDKIASNLIKDVQAEYKDLWEAINYFRNEDPIKTMKLLLPEDTKIGPKKVIKKTPQQTKEEIFRERIRNKLRDLNPAQTFEYGIY